MVRFKSQVYRSYYFSLKFYFLEKYCSSEKNRCRDFDGNTRFEVPGVQKSDLEKSVCINPPYRSHFSYDREDFRYLSFFRAQDSCNCGAQSDYSKVYFTWGRTQFFRFFVLKASFLHLASWFSVVNVVSGYLFPKNGDDLPLRRLHFHRNVPHFFIIKAKFRHIASWFSLVEQKLVLIKHFLKICSIDPF